MILTKNFSLAEFTRSQVASRLGIDNTPPLAVQNSLRDLAIHILQPLRDAVGPIRINSGYRCPALNAAIHGSKFSQHMTGNASDIDVPGMEPIEVAQTCIDLGLPFDQLIHEFRSWVHVSYDTERARRAVLTAELVEGKTQYTNGLA